MLMKFSKYSASGNDFIVIDNRSGNCDTADKNYWQKLCERRLSIGADGVLFLLNSPGVDFEMRYLNADGAEVAMCGNGTRALSHFFCQQNGISEKDKIVFKTKNGKYESSVKNNIVHVWMTEYYDIQKIDLKGKLASLKHQAFYYSNTGVPHCVFLVDDVESVDVVSLGRQLRYDKDFEAGVNTNFISKAQNGYKIRTYERGVEDETLSCGTGITAAARALWDLKLAKDSSLSFYSRGGTLSVYKNDDKVFFGGEVHHVFDGVLC